MSHCYSFSIYRKFILLCPLFPAECLNL